MQVMRKQSMQSVISTENRRGVAAVEFALIAPVFLALLLGMVAVRKAVHTTTVMDAALAEDENGVPLDPMPNPPSTGTDFDLSNSDNRNRLFRIGIEIPEGASNSKLSDIMNLEGSMAKPMSGDPVWDLILNNGTTKIVN